MYIRLKGETELRDYTRHRSVSGEYEKQGTFTSPLPPEFNFLENSSSDFDLNASKVRRSCS
jgi:hypothetical protein